MTKKEKKTADLDENIEEKEEKIISPSELINEQLQQKFTQDVFVSVFEEYEKEGINLDEIHYDDNTDVLDLIQNPTGLLAMLNEECIRPNGSDYGFVHKALHANKTSPALIVPRIRSTVEFGIRHYAADVIYDATDFVSKNQDTLPSDLMEATCTSTNVIIAKEFMKSASVQNPSKTVTASPKRARSGNLVSPTVWTNTKTNSGISWKNCTNLNHDTYDVSNQMHLKSYGEWIMD